MLRTLTPLTLLLLLGACGEAPPPAVVLRVPPPDLLHASAPAGARPIAEVRGRAPGTWVVVCGRVGGAADPFAGDRVRLVDVSVPVPPTQGNAPWEYPGVPADALAAASLNLVVPADSGDGELRADELELVPDLQPLAVVTARGRLQQGAAGLELRVSAMHIEPPARP